MSIVLIKLLMLLAIFVVALIAGRLPDYMVAQQYPLRFFAVSNALSRGFFFGAGLLHLLPDGMQALQHANVITDPTWALTLCGLTFLLLYWFEQGVAKRLFEQSQRSHWLAYLLVLLLSLHSFSAGVALGIENFFIHVFIIFIAIISHKGAAAFAMSHYLYQHRIDSRLRRSLMLIFALMTPAGIVLGASLAEVLASRSGMITEGIVNLIAAGTFLYIATLDKLNHPDNELLTRLQAISLFAVSFLMMAILALVY